MSIGRASGTTRAHVGATPFAVVRPTPVAASFDVRHGDPLLTLRAGRHGDPGAALRAGWVGDGFGPVVAPARPEPRACDDDTDRAARRFEHSMSNGRASGTT
ncbi:MAG TPA: hypothetical protein DCQ98_01830, partial [Planctomycetaceae bacterium]|nr:hypothetical protein [Planctomycetaceae bacterium]